MEMLQPPAKEQDTGLSIADTEGVFTKVAVAAKYAYCCLGDAFSQKQKEPLNPVAPFVKGIPLLKVAVAAVSLVTATESALIEANVKAGEEVEVQAENPVPVIEIVVSLVLATADTVTRVLDV